jgi:hypothetical protein
MTVREFIEKSLRLAGVIAIGENADGAMIDDALDSFKMLCESWSTDAALMPQMYQDAGSFSANQYNYVVGLTGDLAVEMPQKIDQIIVTYNNIRYPMENVSRERYNEINTTNVQSNIPLYYTYSVGQANLGDLSIWPAPLSTLPVSILIRTQDFLQNPAAQILDSEMFGLSQTGFNRAFLYDLAIEFSTQYGIAQDPMIISTAAKLKAQLKRQNSKPVKMNSDVFGFVSKRYFNILKG